MTLLEITDFMKQSCLEIGEELEVEVKLNSRLKTTLGRVKYIGFTATVIEFSSSFVESATKQQVQQVALHEVAHYVSIKRDKTAFGHTPQFRSVCAELGCKADKSTVEVYTKHKYSVVCLSCGLETQRTRKCKLTENTDLYTCKCGGKLQTRRNY